MSIKATIKQYVGDYREFYAEELITFVRKVLGRPKLRDGSIIRKLREMRDEKYIVECLDHQKSFYLVKKEVEEIEITTTARNEPLVFTESTKNLTLF